MFSLIFFLNINYSQYNINLKNKKNPKYRININRIYVSINNLFANFSYLKSQLFFQIYKLIFSF